MDKKRILKTLICAAIMDLKGKDYRVLLYILPKLCSDGQFKKINQLQISEALGITKSNVSLAISNLIRNKLIEADPAYRNVKRVRLCQYDRDNLEDILNGVCCES